MKPKLLLQLTAVSRYLLLGAILQLYFCSTLWAKVNPDQNKSLEEIKVSISLKNADLRQAIAEIEQNTEFSFVYNEKILQKKLNITVQSNVRSLGDVLRSISQQTALAFKRMGDNIHISDRSGQEVMVEDIIGLAPQIIVSGTVTSASDNGGLPGVNVLVKGSLTGTVTDIEGKYSINVPNNDDILVFSSIGFVSQEVPVNGRSVINISMAEDVQALDEIVVIGYGTAKKSDLTGSVGSVNVDQLQERPAASLNQAMAGRIPGVQVNTNSGRPGGRTNIRIRGFSSINSTNNPLYVVDGVQLPMGNQAQFSQAIDYINPNDIVSVEVLKDASSTAIYGARGANGVILITTKKGRAGEGRITYNADFSVNTIGPNRPEVLNAEEYLAVEDLAWRNMEKFDPVGWNAGRWAYLEPRLRRTDPRIFNPDGSPKFDTNWLEETTQNKLSQNHQLGFSGGNENTTYSFSLGYRDDQGLLKNSYLTRYSGRLTVDTNVKKWLKVGTTISYNNQAENLVDISDQVARQIVEDFPFLPVRYEDGTFANNRDYPFAEGTMSSMHRLYGRTYNLNTQTVLGSAFANFQIAEGLQFRTVLGTNVITQETNDHTTRTLDIGNQGNASTRNQKESFWSWENYLTYEKTFNEKHAFTGMLGISWQETNFFFIQQGVRTFATDYFLFNNMGAGSNNLTVGSGANREALNSYFGRFNYSLMNKYLITFTGRADGSSKFGENNKFAFFPSAAVAWRISEEAFLSDNKVISNLKLRASYGLTGNSEIPPYSSLSLLGSNYAAVLNESRVSGTGINRLANPDLRWEKTAQTDIGFELGLFENRITIEGDYYYRLTTDMLLDAPVPQTSGYATIRRNIGSMENRGVEFSLNTVNIDRGSLSWNTTFNISMNRNQVLSLATPADIFNVGGPNFTNPTNIIRIGEPVGSFWGLNRLGVWSEAERAQAAEFVSYRNGLTILPGDVKYQDVNGDKAITDADRMIIGNGNPMGWGALVNTVRYKNFDLTVELQYSYGNDIMDMNLHPSEDRQALANSYRTVLDAWTPENQDSEIAQIRDTRAGYVTNVDTRWIVDGSFIRGRNLLLGYSFPQSVLERLHLSNFRIYTSAQNLFLIVDDRVIGDPEVTPIRGGNGNNAFSQGMKWHEYPKPTTYMFGLQIGL